MSIDWTKEIQTRDGRKARVLATDLEGHRPFVIAITDPDGHEVVKTYGLDGFNSPTVACGSDIINVPTKRKGWVNLYRDGTVFEDMRIVSPPYASEKEALGGADKSSIYIATVPIEWEE